MVRAEFLPLHRSSTTWCIYLGDVAAGRSAQHAPAVLPPWFIEKVFNHDEVPVPVLQSWKGSIIIHVPWSDLSDGYTVCEDSMLDFMKFMSNVPGIKVIYTEDYPFPHQGSPVRHLARLCDRSSPSFVDYVANAEGEGVVDIIVQLNFSTEIALECRMMFRKSRAPGWVRQFIGHRFQNTFLHAIYSLDSFRPYNTFVGIIKPGIKSTIRVRIAQEDVILGFRFSGSVIELN